MDLFLSYFIIVFGFVEVDSNIKSRITNEKPSVCVSTGCVRAASDFLSSIDESVDPCDDFYQFCCGTYLKNAKIPEDEFMVIKNVEVHNHVLEQLRSIIEAPIKKNEAKPFAFLKNSYKVCMDVGAIEEAGLTLARKYLSQIGWPILDIFENDCDWKAMIYKIRKIGFFHSGFFNVYVGTNILNTSQSIITIDEGGTYLHKEYLKKGFSNSAVKAYYDFVVDFAILFGGNRNFIRKEVKDMVDFEIKLAKLLLPDDERRNISAMTHQMTITQLEKQFPQLPWLDYITKVLNLPDLAITKTELVDVTVPSYIPKITALLRETPKRVQQNFITWIFIEELSSTLPQAIRNLKFNFTRITTGLQKIPPRWKECVIEVNKRMTIATSALYVRKYFDDTAKKNVVEIVDNVKRTFINSLRNLSWMDNCTRTRAIEKAEGMINHVAYPEELMDDDKIEEYYSELEFSDKYLLLYLNYQKFYSAKAFGELRKTVNKSDWIYHAGSTAVNAYYSVPENGIELPAGILQDVFFSKDRPQYMNYGGIGFIIGHEITHGFDNQGRQTDKDGRLLDWWTKNTESVFIEKAQCFIDQYNKFTLPNSNLTINGKNTQGENIADNGALKTAYLAYQSWAKCHLDEPNLPALNYTRNQIFWMTIANLWCSKERPEILEKMALTASHSPSKFRVIGSMRNSRQFAKDFKCPLGSKMNPVQKCSIW